MRYLSRIYITLVLLLATVSAVPVSGGNTTLTTSMDSVYVLMGKLTPLHIQLVTDENPAGQLLIPVDSICGNVEIRETVKDDTTIVSPGRIEINRTLMLQSFDSGVYRLNPIKYVASGETIASNRLVLKVLPVPVDTLQTIHDYADISDVDRKFIDYLPDFLVDYGLWILAVIVVLALAAWGVRYFTRKKKVEEGPKINPVSPYDEAIGNLTTLREEKLCEQGREKEYYTRLTDILRNYLQRRFGINAMEMTSTQILHSLEHNEETRLPRRYMHRVLEIADFVKFAKVRPLPDDNVQAFNSAMQFVQDTKPVPPSENPEEEDADSDNNDVEQPVNKEQ